jgi:hypothetical protein
VKIPGRRKYGNTRTVVDGITFASKKEAKRWGELRLLEKVGAITDLQRQVRFALEVNGVKVGAYIADFQYRESLPDWHGVTGRSQLVVEDCKGFRTPEYKLKAKLMRAVHGITIRET